MTTVLDFIDPAATRLDLAGGKGSSLARLTQGGFPVPPGFIVTAAAYREFISGARDLLRGAAGFSVSNAAALEKWADNLRAALDERPLPELLVEEVTAALARHPTGQAFAVRSSSTMEDLAGAAFAGQHDTFLNVAGTADVLARIKSCFLSLWNSRAIAYRHQHGFDPSLAAMAVVVQELVAAEVAGVGFSINPVSGRLDEMVVDSNFGLGESVVAGECEIDHFEIDKATHAVRRAHMGTKSHRVVEAAGGTHEIEVSAAEAAVPSLSPGQLSDVARLLARVEETAGFPQDIEWGLAEGRLHLLQARPVTAIPPRWTRDESAERFPNALTPLTWDFVETGFHDSLRHSFRLMGFPAFDGQWFGMHNHYIYGNQNAVVLYAGRAPFTARTVDELENLIPRLRTEYRWAQDLPVAWMRDLDGYLMRVGQFLATPLADKSDRDLWRFVQDVVAHGAHYFRPNIAISITHSMVCRLLHGWLRMVANEVDAARLFDGLLAWGETKTGQINHELFELARLVRLLPDLEDALHSTSSRDLVTSGELARFPSFASRFDRFLEDHGHREIDFDPYQPPWAEAPWVVLDNVRLILTTPMSPTPAEKERVAKILAQQAEIELLGRLPSSLHFFFHEIVRLARAYTSLDDLEHYQTMRLNIPMRRGLRELGSRLVTRGVLTEPLDIFFARASQITTAIEAGSDLDWSEFGQIVATQKAAYVADAARTPDWETDLAAVAPEEPSGDVLNGLAGSPGVAEGAVFVVLGPDDFARFPKGAVLVARTTNPTWTPLFYSAAAVVTESGGPLSHGAVTAREMRLPAAMSVRGCLSRLENGRRVRVDGTAGRVTLIDDC